jgi:hypothetical protein
LARRACPLHETEHIIGHSFAHCRQLETAAPIALMKSDAPAASRPNDEILVAIAIKIRDAQAGSSLAQLAREQRLDSEVFKGRIDVCVIQECTVVGKQRPGCGRGWGGWAYLSIGFGEFINPTGLDV